MQPFYITNPRTPSEYFCTECIYNINLPEIQDKHFISCFQSHEGECIFKKNAVRLLNKTVDEI